MSGGPSITFNDGAAYEEFMGVWSRLVGEVFLDWLAPRQGLRWADVGCGNGASTALLLDRCAPAIVQGIDPSPEQLDFARRRLFGRPARVQQGSAMDLPFADASLDAALMALVLFFVPEPARGVAEMARVVAPGGLVAAYAWDLPGGGFPIAVVQEEMRAGGIEPPLPPHPEASRQDVLEALWTGAGLRDVAVRAITVTRHFADFETYWAICLRGPATAPVLKALPQPEADALKDRVRARLPVDANGGITVAATANAVKGVKP
ncbi:methyltransferase domain-containing protein [Roseomonas sp. HJA6]|uniref:Methyltransferase domain-containing protein n=1 Tax=Roseomonas alba TaxID=2846776 RepID=A0ABS7A732_9PROT|nr:class I SAM-dependent methyltransferase [Neoroseomonas alba]MBW6397577.1 methyltransferase domain-containing protein [Neoroseomonas alba]